MLSLALIVVLSGDPPKGMAMVPAGVVGSGCPAERSAACLGKAVPPFFIDRQLVTGRQYAACVQSGACTPPAFTPGPPGAHAYVGMPAGYRWKQSDEPVRWLTVAQAEAYCASRRLRLPTEMEWERARETGALDVAQLLSANEKGSSGEDALAEWLDGTYFTAPLAMQLLPKQGSWRFGGATGIGFRVFGFRCSSGT